MSLQTRLFTFFIAIVVLPLGLAALVGQRVMVNELERRTLAQLSPATTAAGAVYQQRFLGARDRVQLISSSDTFVNRLAANEYPELESFVLDRLQSGDVANPIDFMVIADPLGNVLVSAMTSQDFLPTFRPLEASEIVSGSEGGEDPRLFTFTRSIVPITDSEGRQIATVVGGYYLDNEFLQDLAADTGVDAHLNVEGQIVASTFEFEDDEADVMIDLSDSGSFVTTELGDQGVYAMTSPISADADPDIASLVMTTSRDAILNLTRTIQGYLLILVLLAALGSATLGFYLARLIAKPLRELAAGAEAISAGNYDQHIEVRSTDEVGQLAFAFNEMTERLSAHIAKLNESREDLKRALTRFADALRSTHDLDRMLELVLDTSVDTMGARGGTLMWMSPGRESLSVTASRGIEEKDIKLDVGEGIAGTVALIGEPVMVPPPESDNSDVPMASAREPDFQTAVSAPILSDGRPVAVITLFDKQDDEPFNASDLETLQSLARQAGVHVENVLLHQETKRQAIMDPVVGTWNRRYGDMILGQEMDRSRRFRRPFSVMMLDIDDFKLVNDAWGHRRGDEVLIELTARVRSSIRDIDVLARYGGEEFVLILPETDLEGAMATAEKIRASIADTTFKGDPPVDITVSLGVSCYPQHGDDPLNTADQALYAAKSAGKNCVRKYQPDLAA